MAQTLVFSYPARMLSPADLEAKLGCRKSKAWRLSTSPGFPAARKLPTGGKAWVEQEVDAWIAALPEEDSAEAQA